MNKNRLFTLAFVAAAMAQPASAMDYVNKVLPEKYRTTVLALVGGFTLGATAVYCLKQSTTVVNVIQPEKDTKTIEKESKLYTLDANFYDSAKKGFLQGETNLSNHTIFVDEESSKILKEATFAYIACLGTHEMKLFCLPMKKYIILKSNILGSSIDHKDNVARPNYGFDIFRATVFWEPLLYKPCKIEKKENLDFIEFTF